MKIKNTLRGFSDSFLRKLVSYCCKELDLPARFILQVSFRNSKRAWGGRCYGQMVGICVGHESHFPTLTKKHRGDLQERIADRVEALVKVTAHELAHSDQLRRRTKTRQSGSWGGSERDTDLLAFGVLRKFRTQREELLAEWSKESEKPVKATKSVVEKRAAKAKADLAKWQKKLQLAKTKVAKYKAKVSYYDKKGVVPQ